MFCMQSVRDAHVEEITVTRRKVFENTYMPEYTPKDHDISVNY